MSIYLVDYENVNKDGLNGVSKLSDSDTVYIFYSEKADTMSFGLHKRLCESTAQLVFMKAGTGAKNALDFQLSSYLGYIIGKYPKESFYIVTKDTGFEHLCTFWSKNNLHVDMHRVSSINVGSSDSDTSSPKSTAKGKSSVATGKPNTPNSVASDDNVVLQLTSLLCDISLSKDEINQIKGIIEHYKTKSGINNALMTKFPSDDNKKSSTIYQAIKPLLKDKKGR